MVKAQRKIKIKWKNLLAGLLAFLVIVGSIVGIAALATKDTKRVRAMTFSRGAIDADGNFVKSNQSIYTEDFIECQGLTITPDYEASGTYKIFYYTANKNLIGATDNIDANDEAYTKENTFIDAKYARIMITPDASVYAEEGEEFKIRFWQAAKYAREYTITINRKQIFNPHNYYELDADMVGYAYYVDEIQGNLTTAPTSGYYASKWFDVENDTTFKVGMKADFEGTQNLMFVYKLADGKYMTGLHKQLKCENTGEFLWIEIPVKYSTPVVSVSLMVQDCTGKCPDLVIERY